MRTDEVATITAEYIDCPIIRKKMYILRVAEIYGPQDNLKM